MKTFLLLITLIIAANLSAQDCYSPDNLLTISGNVSFTKGLMTPSIKIGFWRNVKSSGVTAYVGYQDASFIQAAVRARKAKIDTVRIASTGFIEVGYKVRLSDKMFTHTYAGVDKTAGYLGTELLYQLGETAMIGLNYRKQMVGFVVLVRLN